MRTRFIAIVSCIATLCTTACGGEPAESTEASAPTAAQSSGAEAAAPAQHGMQIQGTLGTIPQHKIEDLLSSKLPAFQRCFFQGSSEVELLAGAIKFYFRVDADGHVEYVYARQSSVGHRATELCLLDLAKRAHFPKPQGGDGAEFSWGFEIDAPGGARPPVVWNADRVVNALTANRATLDACNLGTAHYSITAYVAPGGAVLGAGAAVDSQSGADKLDCITDAVKAWQMPDPGSYTAKVTFAL